MQLAQSGGAAEISEQTAPARAKPIEVAWVGPRPAWLGDDAATTALEGISIEGIVTTDTSVVHVARGAAPDAAYARAAYPDVPLVFDLGTAVEIEAHTAVEAAGADAVLVESELDARDLCERSPALEGKVTVAPAPVDLEWNAPEERLNRLPGAHIRRFRRLHRLAHPAILFVGPYTSAGGLDLAISAAFRLRDRFEDVRLAAVPLGAVDQKYLDRCEMEALGLGHRGIVEWTVSDDDLRFWYATATVVCCPWRESAEAAVAAPLLAAAAARPFVGSDLPIFRGSVRAPGAPEPVPPADVDALVAALEPLLADLERSSALGASARELAEASYSHEAAAVRLASVWRTLAGRPLTEAA